MMAEFKAAAITLAAVPAFYIGIILFGAPIFDKFAETSILACALAILIVAQIAYTTKGQQAAIEELVFEFMPTTKSQYHSIRCSFGSLIGAWLGAFVIPLDWDRWWQSWPLPCLFGAIIGFIIGLIESYIELYFIPINKRRDKYSSTATTTKNDKVL